MGTIPRHRYSPVNGMRPRESVHQIAQRQLNIRVLIDALDRIGAAPRSVNGHRGFGRPAAAGGRRGGAVSARRARGFAAITGILSSDRARLCIGARGWPDPRFDSPFR